MHRTTFFSILQRVEHDELCRRICHRPSAHIALLQRHLLTISRLLYIFQCRFSTNLAIKLSLSRCLRKQRTSQSYSHREKSTSRQTSEDAIQVINWFRKPFAVTAATISWYAISVFFHFPYPKFSLKIRPSSRRTRPGRSSRSKRQTRAGAMQLIQIDLLRDQRFVEIQPVCHELAIGIDDR